jgi:hypothetical protein
MFHLLSRTWIADLTALGSPRRFLSDGFVIALGRLFKLVDPVTSGIVTYALQPAGICDYNWNRVPAGKNTRPFDTLTLALDSSCNP